MATSGVLLFSQRDERPGRVVCCPHTSFDMAPGQAGPLPRRSIEARLLAVFEDTALHP